MQKSIREGFGLTVSEALWKGKPSSAATSAASRCRWTTASPGIASVTWTPARPAASTSSRDPELGKALGRRGKEHVREHFLTPRYLRDYLRLFGEIGSS